MPGPGGGLSSIDKLANAAISAAMAADRLYGDSPATGYKDGNTAVVHEDGVLRWPNGDPYDPPYDYTKTFHSWKAAIAEAVEPWQDLPAQGPFYDKRDALAKAANKLQPETTTKGHGTGSHVDPGGKLATAIGNLSYDLGNMNSRTVDQFHHAYVSPLKEEVHQGQYALAYVAGECVSAEAEIWANVYWDYVELVDHATQAFYAARDAQCFGSGGDAGSIDLKVVGAVISGAALFVSGGTAGTLIGAAGYGVSLLKDFAPKPQHKTLKVHGSTANEVLASFKKELGKLRDAVNEQEKAIADCLTTNLKAVRKARSSFDLSEPEFLHIDSAMDFDDKDQPGIQVNTDVMRTCGNGTCKKVADFFRAAAASVQGGLGSGPWQRNAYFGSTTGVYDTYAEFLVELQYRAKNTAYEIQKAGRLFAISADYLDAADDGARAEMEKLHKKLMRFEDAYDQQYPHRLDREGHVKHHAHAG
jgi:hypothetical protein